MPRHTAKKRVLSEAKEQFKDVDVKQRPATDPATRKKQKSEPLQNDDEDSEEEFRTNVLNIYLRNKLSAKDTASLLRSAHKSGTRNVEDMRKVGKKTTKKCPKRFDAKNQEGY